MFNTAVQKCGFCEERMLRKRQESLHVKYSLNGLIKNVLNTRENLI